MSIKQKLIDFVNKHIRLSSHSDDYIEYSAAMYNATFSSTTEVENALIDNYEKLHPVDAVECRQHMKALLKAQKEGKLPAECVTQLQFVKPNRHIGEDIFKHSIAGSYEHKDENGNWVEGPALGHGYEGGYADYNAAHKTKFDCWLEKKGIMSFS
jgi:hypothetical protein